MLSVIQTCYYAVKMFPFKLQVTIDMFKRLTSTLYNYTVASCAATRTGLTGEIKCKITYAKHILSNDNNLVRDIFSRFLQ